MKYLAQINIKNNGGCYKFSSDSLDEIRAWAKKNGKEGDTLLILKNGDKMGNAKTFTL